MKMYFTDLDLLDYVLVFLFVTLLGIVFLQHSNHKILKLNHAMAHRNGRGDRSPARPNG